MALIYTNRPKYDLSITFTIYSRTQASDGTMFSQTKHRPFGLRNLQGETLEEQQQQAVQIMNAVAQELHYLTGFGIDKGRVKHSSTTVEEVVYPELTPSSGESLWYSYAIILKFSPRVYKWVQGKLEKYAIDETQLHEGWQKQAIWTGRTSSFKIPVAKEAGFFRLGKYGIEYEKNDAVFTRFISRFREEGNLCYGRSRYFGNFSSVGYNYWPQAKHPERYWKKLPRKSRLATQPTDTTEYVYIIKISRKNIYKIGKSDDPQGRLQSLQTASPHKLKIVHTFKADNASAAEEALHEALHKHRMEGEWFNIPKPQSERLLAIERFETRQFWIQGQGLAASQVVDSDSGAVLTASTNMTHNGLRHHTEATGLTGLSPIHPERQQQEETFQQQQGTGERTPNVPPWKGVDSVMTLEGMSFRLKDLSLDDLVWLRDHQAKYADYYQPTVTMIGNNVTFDKLTFQVNISFKTWSPEVMNCLNEILVKFKPEES